MFYIVFFRVFAWFWWIWSCFYVVLWCLWFVMRDIYIYIYAYINIYIHMYGILMEINLDNSYGILISIWRCPWIVITKIDGLEGKYDLSMDDLRVSPRQETSIWFSNGCLMFVFDISGVYSLLLDLMFFIFSCN